MTDIIMDFLRYIVKHRPEDFQGKRILEVGSLNVNGTARDVFQKVSGEYVGTDMLPGKDVDQVVDAERLVYTFGKDSFDVVVCTGTLEHCEHWKVVVSEIKQVLRIPGLLVIDAASPGFPYHSHPNDYWRFTVSSFLDIFDDLDLLLLEKTIDPSVAIVARKIGPVKGVEDLADIDGVFEIGAKPQFSMLWNAGDLPSGIMSEPVQGANWVEPINAVRVEMEPKKPS